MTDAGHSSDLDRYVRQMRYPPLGEQGQRRLMGSRALICGCGALGSVIANTLCRAGVGKLRIVDRDFVETNNLQRQVLFDEQDVAQQLPKAIAAAEKLRSINSAIEIEPIVTDVDHTNIESLVAGSDIILDGTDNFETRFLLNDAAIQFGVPWVYGGCVGAGGHTITIIPGQTPCLRCLMQEPPPHGATETCDTAGILGSIVNVVASMQAIEAIKILSGNREAVNPSWTMIDLWDNRQRQVKLAGLQGQTDCPACTRGEFPWLKGERGSHAAILCGRNAVQLNPAGRERISLEGLAEKLASVGKVHRNPFLLRLNVDRYALTVFPDGRAIVAGTDDISIARSLYAKYIGN